LARCLIIGCGCRGQLLARELISAGNAVRGTTRSDERVGAIEASGAEAAVADPDRVATLVPALDHVSVACILLGSAVGSPAELQALHTSRLEMLLTKLVDTTARGVVYEARGSVDQSLLSEGAERVRAFAQRSLAACRFLEADPGSPREWVRAAVDAVERVLRAPESLLSGRGAQD